MDTKEVRQILAKSPDLQVKLRSLLANEINGQIQSEVKDALDQTLEEYLHAHLNPYQQLRQLMTAGKMIVIGKGIIAVPMLGGGYTSEGPRRKKNRRTSKGRAGTFAGRPLFPYCPSENFEIEQLPR